MDGKDENISLDRLLLDESNFRIDEVDRQLSAIIEIMEHQDEGVKIYNLAEHVSRKKQLAPGERLLVIPNDQQNDEKENESDFYVVMEGNRRLTALMLLRNPEIIRSRYPKICEKFLKLDRTSLDSLYKSIPCSVLQDRDTALEWVEIKHGTNLNGVGLEKWDANASARFSESRGNYRRWRIALKKLENSNSTHIKTINTGIRNKTTAVERVLAARATRETLKMDFRNSTGDVKFIGIGEPAGISILENLMLKMSESNFKTATVHSLQDREKFIFDFKNSISDLFHTPETESKTSDGGIKNNEDSESNGDIKRNKNGESDKNSDNEQSNEPNNNSASKPHKKSGKKPKKCSTDRLYLAPNSLGSTYHIDDSAVNKVYLEARKLAVDGFERVSGVTTRVFLELSCDLYLLEKKIPLPAHFSKKSIKRWTDAKLREKVEKVIECLDPNKHDKELSQVRKGLGSDEWLHSIDTLHSFVHNKLGDVSSREVKMIWDRYHPLFKKIHEALEKG